MDIRKLLRRTKRYILTRIWYTITKFEKKEITCNGVKFKVEIADTKRKIWIGLMYRTKLSRNEGMLFVFANDAKHGFWMFETKISLDIVWLNKNKRIVYVVRDAQPCRSILDCETIYPDKKARYALEFKAGVAKELGIKLGDTMSI
ncbi:MAG: DUF192 domain-containing protein [Candidatus Micrarchaeaceae archaeon]